MSQESENVFSQTLSPFEFNGFKSDNNGAEHINIQNPFSHTEFISCLSPN